MPFEIFQVTAQYSNAVLLAVMPYVTDFAKNLDLPIPQPITISHVREFKCSPRSGGAVLGHDELGAAENFRKRLMIWRLVSPRQQPLRLNLWFRLGLLGGANIPAVVTITYSF